MTAADVLTDAFGRINDAVHEVADGLVPGALVYRPDARSNSIAWLLWHLTRVQDDHVAAAFGADQVWTTAGWCDRFALPFDPSATGYDQSAEDVAEVIVDDPTLLTGYHDATCRATLAFLEGIGDAELSRVVDERWDPPVTLGVRLVSVVADDWQHVGQAAYVRGLFERR
ncbi:MAG TPA: DinB family protein [Acidimicrobiales bacterium]|nr:DinB family protein [Acidimicrobiales bacterium]